MKTRKEINKELQNKIDLGNKRLAIVCSTIAFILSIPFYILIDLTDFSDFWVMISYLTLVCISVLFSPKIASKIWKND